MMRHRGKNMASRTQRVLEERFARKSPNQAIKSRNASAEDVRSKVEQQFSLMEQTHDRIRMQELATRLRERPDDRSYLL